MGGELSAPAEATLAEALAAYGLNPPAAAVSRYGAGHINDTFLVSAGTGAHDKVILQRMSAAFPHPEQVMANLVGITEHLKTRVSPREALTVLPTASGAAWYADTSGRIWRTFPFLEGTVCLERADTTERLHSAGQAFGRFLRLLRDYPADSLYETIPRFHDTEHRLALLKAAATADKLGRVRECQAELEFALAREGDCAVLRRANLPLRVTHNDTKLSNLLFDQATGKALCILDLDTVMPGLAPHDFGDAIRAGAKDRQAHFDLALFEAYARGYLSQTGDILTHDELRLLPWGARIMTLECGIRYLTDYLLGEPYFRTAVPGETLCRCRAQFSLLQEMEGQFGVMEQTLAQYI